MLERQSAKRNGGIDVDPMENRGPRLRFGFMREDASGDGGASLRLGWWLGVRRERGEVRNFVWNA